MNILVYINAEHGVHKSALEVVTYAKKIGGTVTVVGSGKADEAALASLGKYGAEKVLNVTGEKLKNFINQAYASVISDAANQQNADIVPGFFPVNRRDYRRIAYILSASPQKRQSGDDANIFAILQAGVGCLHMRQCRPPIPTRITTTGKWQHANNALTLTDALQHLGRCIVQRRRRDGTKMPSRTWKPFLATSSYKSRDKAEPPLTSPTQSSHTLLRHAPSAHPGITSATR